MFRTVVEPAAQTLGEKKRPVSKVMKHRAGTFFIMRLIIVTCLFVVYLSNVFPEGWLLPCIVM
jgi:hypothetical protein